MGFRWNWLADSSKVILGDRDTREPLKEGWLQAVVDGPDREEAEAEEWRWGEGRAADGLFNASAWLGYSPPLFT